MGRHVSQSGGGDIEEESKNVRWSANLKTTVASNLRGSTFIEFPTFRVEKLTGSGEGGEMKEIDGEKTAVGNEVEGDGDHDDDDDDDDENNEIENEEDDDDEEEEEEEEEEEGCEKDEKKVDN